MDGNTFEKIEMIREKTKLSFEEAEAILEKFNGDVVEALIHCERIKRNRDKNFNERVTESEFVNYIKSLIKSGNVAKIIIRKDENILVNIPVNAGILVGVALLLQPVLIVIGAATAVFTHLEVDIIKQDGSIEVVNVIVKNTVKTTVKVVTEVTQELKKDIATTYGKFKEKISR
ncbi:MAG: DUF4342 domain-containing protein [Clostridium sp.]|uniref:DUF4342 domain-containing protein n=1 Tax=Clostridium sp. TaxID=1506 RepID=UPI003054BE5A